MMGMGMGAAPLPPQGGMPMDPTMMGAPPHDEMVEGEPAAPQFPSIDPNIVGQILQMLGGLQQQDHQNLQSQQDSVLMSLLQAMGIGGAPVADDGFAEGGDAMSMPEETAQGF